MLYPILPPRRTSSWEKVSERFESLAQRRHPPVGFPWLLVDGFVASRSTPAGWNGGRYRLPWLHDRRPRLSNSRVLAWAGEGCGQQTVPSPGCPPYLGDHNSPICMSYGYSCNDFCFRALYWIPAIHTTIFFWVFYWIISAFGVSVSIRANILLTSFQSFPCISLLLIPSFIKWHFNRLILIILFPAEIIYLIFFFSTCTSSRWQLSPRPPRHERWKCNHCLSHRMGDKTRAGKTDSTSNFSFIFYYLAFSSCFCYFLFVCICGAMVNYHSLLVANKDTFIISLLINT